MFGQDQASISHNTYQRNDLRNNRRIGRSLKAQLRRAPFSENQHVIGQGVYTRSHNRNPQHNLRSLKGGQIGLQHHNKQRGHNSETRNT